MKYQNEILAYQSWIGDDIERCIKQIKEGKLKHEHGKTAWKCKDNNYICSMCGKYYEI